MDKPHLSNKIRVVSNRKKAANCTEKRLGFYAGYATTVSQTLRKPLFQRFLHWILKREEIEKRDVKDIQIRVFPFQKENGKFLAGRCNVDGVIRVFPKRWAFIQEKLRNHKKENIKTYVRRRAMATLIHEILHVKYGGDEGKVRHLTEKYFKIFMHHQNQDVLSTQNIQKMFFAF